MKIYVHKNGFAHDKDGVSISLEEPEFRVFVNKDGEKEWYFREDNAKTANFVPHDFASSFLGIDTRSLEPTQCVEFEIEIPTLRNNTINKVD